MQRNRMAEKSDPDFVRNYDNYRPSFAPYRQLADPGGGGGSGGYGGGGGGAGRGGRGGREAQGLGGHGGHGQQPQPSPRLLHQHQVRFILFSAHKAVARIFCAVLGSLVYVQKLDAFCFEYVYFCLCRAISGFNVKAKPRDAAQEWS